MAAALTRTAALCHRHLQGLLFVWQHRGSVAFWLFQSGLQNLLWVSAAGRQRLKDAETLL